MLAWYFGTADKKLRYNDNRKIIIGKMHTVKGDPVVCKHGLHGSERLIDALTYAPGPILYRVDITRRIAQQKDKIAGQRRQYLSGFDATLLLQEFSRKQALINIDRIKPYINSSNYQIILDWLLTGDNSVKEAARMAAEAAADSDAWSDAWSAARVAARAVAEAAADSNAWSAAWSAARMAADLDAWSAADSDAWSDADDMLTNMVMAELNKQGEI